VPEAQADIGLIGLAVMGQNLVLNMADHGFRVAVYNRTTEKTHQFLERTAAEEPSADRVQGTESLDELVSAIKRPRKIMIMVQAGRGTDAVIDQLTPMLDEGDILIDGGNAQWTDTIRRERDLKEKGIYFVGSGVSGGEVGARFGPSLMPGGDARAWEQIEPIFKAIAAKVDPRSGKPVEGGGAGKPITEGEPCTTHVGADGAGHYVKMVHNGIEYIDMQLICEAYQLMKEVLGILPRQMSDVFSRWNQDDLDSFLIEITADILQQPDPANPERYLVDAVLDTAGQKGTGRWTAINALEMGVPANAIAEAVFARVISALKDQRVEASKTLNGPGRTFEGDGDALIEAIYDALYCSKICAYAQGFQLMAQAQAEYGWRLDFAEIARIWRGGCIIRARFLQKIGEAYQQDPGLANLMLAPYFQQAIDRGQQNWRYVVSVAAQHGIPTPAFMSALSYYDGYRTPVLPANLLQAQRDYFGAHTFQRTDAPREKSFHVDWPHEDRPMHEV
jgi:6-phosphogluconate dehydrogenase